MKAVVIGGGIGGLAAAVALPFLTLEAAFLAMGGACFTLALLAAFVIRDAPGSAGESELRDWTLRDARLWRLCLASGLYVVAQVALIGFVVLFLHEERGLSAGAAAAVLAAVQVLAAALRIGAGRWSDVLRSRVVPLRHVGVATAATVALCAALLSAPVAVLVPTFVVAGGLSMAWNGLSFAAVAELAGRARSGAAIGVQQSVLAAAAVGAPVAFAAVVSATSWRAAFAIAALSPLLGWRVLAPLGDQRVR